MNYDENTREGRHLTPEERIALQAEEIKQLRARVAQYRGALEQTKGFIKGMGCYCNYEGEYASQCQPCFIVEQIDKALAEIDKVIGGKEEKVLPTCNVTKLPCAGCNPVCEHRGGGESD